MEWTDVFRREWMNYVVCLLYKTWEKPKPRDPATTLVSTMAHAPITPNFSVRREPWNCLGSCWEIDAGITFHTITIGDANRWCLNCLVWSTSHFKLETPGIFHTLRTTFDKGDIIYVFSLWATYVMFSASSWHGSWPFQLSYYVG